MNTDRDDQGNDKSHYEVTDEDIDAILAEAAGVPPELSRAQQDAIYLRAGALARKGLHDEARALVRPLRPEYPEMIEDFIRRYRPSPSW